MDVLGHYLQQTDRPPPQVHEDFDHVAQDSPPEALGRGLEDAFKSDATPPFEQMVGQLFGRSNPQQRAGFLNELLGSLRGTPVSPEDAQHVPVKEVEAAAAEAARANPSIIERASRFYANHPQLVQTLGNVALSIAMSSMARRRRV